MTDQELYELVIHEIVKSVSSFYNLSYQQVLAVVSEKRKIEGIKCNKNDCLTIAERSLNALTPLVEKHRLNIGDVLFILSRVL